MITSVVILVKKLRAALPFASRRDTDDLVLIDRESLWLLTNSAQRSWPDDALAEQIEIQDAIRAANSALRSTSEKILPPWPPSAFGYGR